MEYLGLLASVSLLIWLAQSGVDSIFASLLYALLVIFRNAVPWAYDG